MYLPSHVCNAFYLAIMTHFLSQHSDSSSTAYAEYMYTITDLMTLNLDLFTM